MTEKTSVVDDHERALRRVRIALATAVIVLLIGLAGIAFTVNEKLDDFKRSRDAFRADFTSQQDALEKANRRLVRAGAKPVTPPVPQQPSEVDDPDPDDPESQELEHQDPEQQQPEVQDPEVQEREHQDGDPNDPDPNDPDPNDPEVQDPEIQDPEIDDPDPNSLLDFQVADRCNPAPGVVVTDVALSLERSPGVLTFVLTCSSTPTAP